MHISLADLYELLESSFDLLLVLDEKGRTVHACPLFCMECGIPRDALLGKQIEVLREAPPGEKWEGRIVAIRQAMDQAKAGKYNKLVLTSQIDPGTSYTVNCGYSPAGDNGLYIFYGSKIRGLSAYAEWEKEERIKELSCLYAVGDWIENSNSVKEFFSGLPRYVAPGMHYPERCMVYSVYQGAEYGKKPISAQFLSVDLIVNNQVRGRILVGYESDDFGYLPEEQKMLDEIGRMLNIALERKEFKERLALKQEEEAEYARRLGELEREISERTSLLESQKEKLGTVNAYLDRLNKDWEESRTRLETIFRAIPDKAALIDRKRNVVMTNRENVIPGDKCYKTIFGTDTPCPDCRLARIVKEKTPLRLDIRHGDEFYEVHALPIYNEQHEVEGIFEFYKDVTREKVYEKQLQQADKLASLGQLVSGIGHEINNPNQFIRGNIRIIEQSLADVLPILDEYYKEHPDLKIARLKYEFFREHVMTLVSDMAHGSERIKGIVEGLKSFARKDEGLLVDTVDVNTVVAASARLAHNQAHKSADIELELARDLPSIPGNAQKIEQIMINLLINAAQAMPDGRRGLIIVATRRENDGIVIEVKDNGTGMSERTLKNIFDPFFTTRRAKGGTGLGLPIVFRIVEEHKGSIQVSSKIDAGTTFTINLPINPAVARVPAEKEESMYGGRR